MTCRKCGGTTTIKTEKAIGSFPYCEHCGPQYVPPYTPERMARTRCEQVPMPAEADGDAK